MGAAVVTTSVELWETGAGGFKLTSWDHLSGASEPAVWLQHA